MTLGEIGGILRAERERQGLSVNEVMERTKLSRLNIEAIEQGRTADMPHPVYAKGFIRNYAQVLGLDAEQMLRGYAPVDEPARQLAPRGSDAASPARYPRRAGGLLPKAVSALLLAVLAAAGFLLTGNRLETHLPGLLGIISPGAHPAPAPARPGAPGTTAATSPAPPSPPAAVPPPSPAAVPASQAAPEAPHPVQAPAAPPAAPPIAAPAPVKAEAKAEVAAPAMSSAPGAAPAPAAAVPAAPAPAGVEPAAPAGAAPAAKDPSGLKLAVIRAVEACWMQARFPDGRVREFYLKPGDAAQLEFRGFVDLKLGNSGGVRITVDGQEFPFDGAAGQVRTVKLQ